MILIERAQLNRIFWPLISRVKLLSQVEEFHLLAADCVSEPSAVIAFSFC